MFLAGLSPPLSSDGLLSSPLTTGGGLDSYPRSAEGTSDDEERESMDAHHPARLLGGLYAQARRKNRQSCLQQTQAYRSDDSVSCFQLPLCCMRMVGPEVEGMHARSHLQDGAALAHSSPSPLWFSSPGGRTHAPRRSDPVALARWSDLRVRHVNSNPQLKTMHVSTSSLNRTLLTAVAPCRRCLFPLAPRSLISRCVRRQI